MTNAHRRLAARSDTDCGSLSPPNPEYVGVVEEDSQIFLLGPSKLSDLAAYDIELDLDAIERGDRRILPDEDGDPRLY